MSLSSGCTVGSGRTRGWGTWWLLLSIVRGLSASKISLEVLSELVTAPLGPNLWWGGGSFEDRVLPRGDMMSASASSLLLILIIISSGALVISVFTAEFPTSEALWQEFICDGETSLDLEFSSGLDSASGGTIEVFFSARPSICSQATKSKLTRVTHGHWTAHQGQVMWMNSWILDLVKGCEFRDYVENEVTKTWRIGSYVNLFFRWRNGKG